MMTQRPQTPSLVTHMETENMLGVTVWQLLLTWRYVRNRMELADAE